MTINLIYSHTDLEARSPESKCGQVCLPSQDPRGESSLASPSSGSYRNARTPGCITPIPGCIFTWSSPLCLSSLPDVHLSLDLGAIQIIQDDLNSRFLPNYMCKDPPFFFQVSFSYRTQVWLPAISKANIQETGVVQGKTVYSSASSLKRWQAPTPKTILTSQYSRGFY